MFWIFLLIAIPLIVYYWFGKRYDRVRPLIPSSPITPLIESDTEALDGMNEDEEDVGDLPAGLLAKNKIFGFLERKVFDLLVRHLIVKEYTQGQAIEEEGGFMMVLDGWAELITEELGIVRHKIGKGGAITSLFAILEQFIGESIEIPKKARVSAIENAKVLIIPKKAFAEIAQDHPHAVSQITSIILTRFYRVTFLSLYKYLGLESELSVIDTIMNDGHGQCQDPSQVSALKIIKAYLTRDHDSEFLAAWQQEILDKECISITTHEEGEALIRSGEHYPGILVILKGSVEGVSAGKSLFKINEGGLVGVVASFTSQTAMVNIVASDGVAVTVATLSRKGTEILKRHNQNAILRIAEALIKSVSPFINTVDLILDWKHLNAGIELLKIGDPADYLYLVLHGRLRALDKGNEYAQGNVIGVSPVLFQSPTYTKTLVAIRDSELACLPRALFETLSQSIPSVALSMTRAIAMRSSWMSSYSKPLKPLTKTVVLFPASPGVPLLQFAEKLLNEVKAGGYSCQIVNSSVVVEVLGREAFSAMGKLKLLEWLAAQEETNRLLLFLTDGHPNTPWSQRCLRQADCVVIVALASEDPKASRLEKMSLGRKGALARKELVLLHGQRLCAPGLTLKWLKQRPWVTYHHHVFMTGIEGYEPIDSHAQVYPDAYRHQQYQIEHYRDALISKMPGAMKRRFDHPIPRVNTVGSPCDDFGRLARRLLGQTVGVVLSGGGAKGVAHVGVLRALREAGIPVDVIGGTSMGAFVGGLFASDGDVLSLPSRIRYFSTRAGSKWRQFLDVTWPYCSLFTGHAFNRVLWKLFGNYMIDDLWIPFYCVTTDITASRKAVHRSDRLCDDYVWRYVRGSMSLSGLFPPICDRDGHMHVDGGYVSTLPVEVMKDEMEADFIIAIDVSALPTKEVAVFGDASSGFLPALQRLVGMTPQLPSLADIQSRIAFVASDTAAAVFHNSADIFLIRPSVQHYSILDILEYAEIMKLGYEAGRESLAKWREDGTLDALLSVSPHIVPCVRHRRQSL